MKGKKNESAPSFQMAELLERAKRGDRAAFGEIYDLHHAMVWRFTLHLTGSRAVTADIVHDVFLAILTNPNRFDSERGIEFEQFLLGVANNLVLKHWRKFGREVPLTEAGDCLDYAFEIQANQALDLSKALQFLSEQHQEVLRMSDDEDLTMREISEILSTTVPAVKSLLFRARERIKKALGRDYRDGV